MSDYLVDLNPAARKLIKTLGLPLPLPQKLRRAKGPQIERPLDDRRVVVAGEGGALHGVLGPALARAGANVAFVGAAPQPYLDAAEAYARPVELLEAEPHEEEPKANAIIVDASSVGDAASLRMLYDALHPRVRRILGCARVVVFGRPPEEAGSAAEAAARAALDGFTRSVAKEIGGKGATANLITVSEGAEARLEPVLRFVLSDRSAFVSGQTFRVSDATIGDASPALTRVLEGRVALVTGAARGIGAATAARLAEEGARVLLLDRPDDEDLLRETAQSVGGIGVAVDVTAKDAGARILKHLEAEGLGLDVIVHNAGVTRDRTLGKMKPESWDLVMAVNLEAILRLNEALLPKLGAGGRVVMLSSIGGIAGNMGQTNYGATKAGVAGLARYLGPALAARGVTVNAIAPGFIETRMTAAIPMATREPARRLSNLSQGGLPEDIAEAVTFLASPGAVGLTGQVLRVCGGNFIGA